MRPSPDDGRRGRHGARRARASRPLRGAGRLRGLTALVTAGTVAVATAAAATSSKPVVVKDSGTDAADGAIDVTRVQLGRAADGRLRGAITAADSWAAADLVAEKGGPPGSLCLRLYTAATTKVDGAVPEHLVCVTADAGGDKLRGAVLKERPNDLPQRVGTATVSRPSPRTVVLKFSQSAIGRPATVRFSGESTRAGCARTSCVDAAPDVPKVGTLKLREPSATTNQPG